MRAKKEIEKSKFMPVQICVGCKIAYPSFLVSEYDGVCLCLCCKRKRDKDNDTGCKRRELDREEDEDYAVDVFVSEWGAD